MRWDIMGALGYWGDIGSFAGALSHAGGHWAMEGMCWDRGGLHWDILGGTLGLGTHLDVGVHWDGAGGGVLGHGGKLGFGDTLGHQE